MNLLIKLVKNSVFIFCYNKLFKKLLNVENRYFELYTFLLCIPISLLYSLVDNKIPYASYPALILGLALFHSKHKKIPFETGFFTSLISFGITYIIFSVCASITAMGTVLLTSKDMNVAFSPLHILICQTISASLELIITILVCRIRRLKNGLSFIHNQNYTTLEVCISICIVILSAILSKGKADIYYFSLFLLIYVFMIMLILYDRIFTTNVYIEALTKRTIEDLNFQLLEREKQYNLLLADKEHLSEIVHRDNKLIPALELAVTNYLKDGTDSTQGKELLAEIKRLSKGRHDLLESIEKEYRPLTLCHITSIDNLLSFMYQQAAKQEIAFEVKFLSELQNLIDSPISIDDFSTLLADLTENAIRATKNSEKKSIVVSFSTVKGSYTLQITDSGTPFSVDTLANIGRKPITTCENGSGIGMMQTFKILDQYHASLIINEYQTDDGFYSKTISVVWDNKKHFILYTNRDKNEISQLYNRTDLTIIQKS